MTGYGVITLVSDSERMSDTYGQKKVGLDESI
jgi:hypothetical protein